MKCKQAILLRQLLLALLFVTIFPLFSTGNAAQSFANTPEKNIPGQGEVARKNAHAATQESSHAVAQATGQEEGKGEVHASPILSKAKLKDLFWRTINFIALLIILVKFFGKSVVGTLTGRQQQIADELAELTKRRDEAESTYNAFTTKIAGMEKEMERIAAQAIGQAQLEKERILAEAERSAEDIKRQAEAAVQGEVEEARRRLREEVAEKAASMATELISKNLTPADQGAIIEQYLEKVEAAL